MNSSDLNQITDNDNQVNVAQKPRSVWGLVGLGITAGSVFALCVGTTPFVLPALRKYCLPFVPATDTQIRNVISALPRKGTLVDIGSGDGRIVFAAAKNGFKATGYELNTWLVLYSKIKCLRLGLGSNATFAKRDLWKTDLKEYNNVVIFGVEQMMAKLEEKLQCELKNDAHVVACRFPFPKWQPIKSVGVGIDRVWLYNIPRSFMNIDENAEVAEDFMK